VRLMRKTSKNRLRRSLVAINDWLRNNRNMMPLPDLWTCIKRKIQGHLNYFGVTDNSRSLNNFHRTATLLIFKCLNRCSQRRRFTWKSFARYLTRFPLPTPRIRVNLNPMGRMAR
jgi:hypothetical protein